MPLLCAAASVARLIAYTPSRSSSVDLRKFRAQVRGGHREAGEVRRQQDQINLEGCIEGEPHNHGRRIRLHRFHIARQITGSVKAVGVGFAVRPHQLDNEFVPDRDIVINAQTVPLYLYHFGLDWFIAGP